MNYFVEKEGEGKDGYRSTVGLYAPFVIFLSYILSPPYK